MLIIETRPFRGVVQFMLRDPIFDAVVGNAIDLLVVDIEHLVDQINGRVPPLCYRSNNALVVEQQVAPRNPVIEPVTVI